MIERLVGGGATLTLLAASALPARQPVILHFLGYPFEAAGMVAAIFACFCARYWSGNQLRLRKAFRWHLDIPVSALTFAATVVVVITRRPEPLPALVYGTGIGMLGEAIFKLAQRSVDKFNIFGDPLKPTVIYGEPPNNPPAPEIDEVVRRLDD